MKYEKGALSISDQIQRLADRGLIIDSRAEAETALSAISYYRLSAYCLPYESMGGKVHEFISGTTLREIVDLYTFDHKLRMIFFDALERVETAFRTQLIYQYSMDHGGWWFEERGLFRQGTSLQEFLDELDKQVQRSKEVFTRHYLETYGDPPRPPAWIAFEVASLGQLSRLYTNLRPNPAKKRIAAYFGVGIPVLESWMGCLTFIRNTCAHHARIWNKTLVTRPMMPTLPLYPIPILDPALRSGERLFAGMILVQYCLKRIGTLSSFPRRILELIQAYPRIELAKMGFPQDWHKNQYWGLYAREEEGEPA